MASVGNVRKITQADLYVAKLYPNTNFNGEPLLGCVDTILKIIYTER
nr:hypothetical protein [Clostridium botulinum]